MGAPSSAWLDGGYGKTGKAGMGSAKRITITAASNFKTGMKIQMIDTIIDLYGDTATVFGEHKSNDLSEFLGRAGVTLVKAGVTAALGAAIAAGILAGITALSVAFVGAAVALPVLLIATVVIGGYVLAATIIDLTDEAFQIKERAAEAAR